MLRQLRRSHEVHYVALDDGAVTKEARDAADDYASTVTLVPHQVVGKYSPRFYFDVARRAFSATPVVLQRYASMALTNAIEQVCAVHGPMDLAVCDFLFPALSIPREMPAPTVLFQHNVEARIWRRHAETSTGIRRWFFEHEHRKMQKAEAALSHRFDGVIAVSESDADEMRNDYGLPRVGVVETGVDTEFFRPNPLSVRTPAEIMFLGSMDWMPNADGVLWFAREVLPLVRRRIPAVRFTIVGRSPTDAVRALAGPGVEVTGTVPDVRPFLARAAMMVVPLRIGGGTRIKLFEAMAAEVPCVSTTIGAEGLPVVDGAHLVLADSPAAFAQRVIEMLEQPEQARAMGRRAADLVRSRFDWSRIAEQFLDECARVVEPRGLAHGRGPS